MPIRVHVRPPDYRDLIDTKTPYLLRLEHVVDRATRIGEALEWTFTVHDNATGEPICKPGGWPLVVSRMTSPQTGSKTRTRRFINALLGRELTRDQMAGLIQSGTLAQRLKHRTATGYLALEDADDGNTYLSVHELSPIDASTPSPTTAA